MKLGSQFNSVLALFPQLARISGATYPRFHGAAASSDLALGFPTTIYSGFIYLIPELFKCMFKISFTEPPLNTLKT